MTYLLDTHTLLWIALFPDLLSPKVRPLVENSDNDLLVSSATALEIATKVRLGKLPEGAVLETNYKPFTQQLRIRSVPVTTSIALRAGRLSQVHRDPFDRIISATALSENLVLLSKDTLLDNFGVQRIW